MEGRHHDEGLSRDKELYEDIKAMQRKKLKEEKAKLEKGRKALLKKRLQDL